MSNTYENISKSKRRLNRIKKRKERMKAQRCASTGWLVPDGMKIEGFGIAITAEGVNALDFGLPDVLGAEVIEEKE